MVVRIGCLPRVAGHVGSDVPGRGPHPSSCARRQLPGGRHRTVYTARSTVRVVEAPNILREDLPFPLGVLRASVLERNLTRFQQFSDAAGVLLCPHAKTTMAPALFRRQLAAGSWGLTFPNGPQLRAAREHGVPRIFYANELVGAADIRYVCAELRRGPAVSFSFPVASVAGGRLAGAPR